MRGKNNDEFKKRYLGELQYANNRVKIAIEKMLTHSMKKPVIIIQADHGSSISNPVGEIPPKEYLHQKFAILNTYYLQDSDHTNLYPEITPVNSFRIVLNHCFKTELPLLKDQIYYSRWETPYNTYNITDSLIISSTRRVTTSLSFPDSIRESNKNRLDFGSSPE